MKNLFNFFKIFILFLLSINQITINSTYADDLYDTLISLRNLSQAQYDYQDKLITLLTANSKDSADFLKDFARVYISGSATKFNSYVQCDFIQERTLWGVYKNIFTQSADLLQQYPELPHKIKQRFIKSLLEQFGRNTTLVYRDFFGIILENLKSDHSRAFYIDRHKVGVQLSHNLHILQQNPMYASILDIIEQGTAAPAIKTKNHIRYMTPAVLSNILTFCPNDPLLARHVDLWKQSVEIYHTLLPLLDEPARSQLDDSPAEPGTLPQKYIVDRIHEECGFKGGSASSSIKPEKIIKAKDGAGRKLEFELSQPFLTLLSPPTHATSSTKKSKSKKKSQDDILPHPNLETSSSSSSFWVETTATTTSTTSPQLPSLIDLPQEEVTAFIFDESIWENEPQWDETAWIHQERERSHLKKQEKKMSLQILPQADPSAKKALLTLVGGAARTYAAAQGSRVYTVKNRDLHSLIAQLKGHIETFRGNGSAFTFTIPKYSSSEKGELIVDFKNPIVFRFDVAHNGSADLNPVALKVFLGAALKRAISADQIEIELHY